MVQPGPLFFLLFLRALSFERYFWLTVGFLNCVCPQIGSSEALRLCRSDWDEPGNVFIIRCLWMLFIYSPLSSVGGPMELAKKNCSICSLLDLCTGPFAHLRIMSLIELAGFFLGLIATGVGGPYSFLFACPCRKPYSNGSQVQS